MITLRSLAFNVAFFVVTLVLTVAGSVIRLIAPRRVRGLARFWARLVLLLLRWICGIRLEVTGLENLPPGAALIASRHQSAFDTVVWLTLTPCCCYVVKQELLRIPLFGKLIEAVGMIAVDRSAGAAALRGLVRGGERASRAGMQIVIFPEGTRSEPGPVKPLQPGVAALAGRTGLPVVPVATNSGAFWGRRAFHKRPGTIRILVRQSLPPTLRREEMMRRLREELAMPGEEMPDRPVEKSVG
jgi:1-acyl-sn-glycerol-3-phosphate acyltransferase